MPRNKKQEVNRDLEIFRQIPYGVELMMGYLTEIQLGLMAQESLVDRSRDATNVRPSCRISSHVFGLKAEYYCKKCIYIYTVKIFNLTIYIHHMLHNIFKHITVMFTIIFSLQNKVKMFLINIDCDAKIIIVQHFQVIVYFFFLFFHKCYLLLKIIGHYIWCLLVQKGTF